MRPLTRSDVLQLVGLVIALAAILTSVVLPEIRLMLFGSTKAQQGKIVQSEPHADNKEAIAAPPIPPSMDTARVATQLLLRLARESDPSSVLQVLVSTATLPDDTASMAAFTGRYVLGDGWQGQVRELPRRSGESWEITFAAERACELPGELPFHPLIQCRTTRDLGEFRPGDRVRVQGKISAFIFGSPALVVTKGPRATAGTERTGASARDRAAELDALRAILEEQRLAKLRAGTSYRRIPIGIVIDADVLLPIEH